LKVYIIEKYIIERKEDDEGGDFELRGYLAQEDEDSFLICFRLSGEDVECLTV